MDTILKRVLAVAALILLVGIAYKQKIHADTVGSWSCSLAASPFMQGTTTYTSWSCTNGSNTVQFPSVPEPAAPASTWFSDEAAILVAQLTANAALTPPAVGSPITPTPPVIPVTPPPPPAAVTQFQADDALALECQAAIAQNLIPSSDPTCTADIATAVSDFTANETTLLPYVQVPR